MMPADEIVALLNTLLEAERAGAKVLAAYLDDFDRNTPASLNRKMDGSGDGWEPSSLSEKRPLFIWKVNGEISWPLWKAPAEPLERKYPSFRK